LGVGGLEGGTAVAVAGSVCRLDHILHHVAGVALKCQVVDLVVDLDGTLTATATWT
jgi:hypothetical protein